MANNDLLNDNDISLIANMQNVEFKEKKKNITVFIFVGVVIALIIGITIGIAVSNKISHSGELGKLMAALEKTYSSSSLETDEVLSIKDKNNNKLIYTLENELIKKDNNYRLSSIISDSKEKISLGGLFLNDERIEIVFQDDQSVFFRYKDIFDIVKTYIPTLDELMTDLDKINYQRYATLYRKEFANFKKNCDFKSYYKYIDDLLNKNVTHEKDVCIINGKKDEYDIYKIEMSAREMIKNKVTLLTYLKTDKNIRKFIGTVNNNTLEYIQKTRDYEHIRMTLDEFNTFKMKYSNELLNIYDEYIDGLINNYQTVYSRVSPDEKETYTFYIDDNNELVKIDSQTTYLLNNEIVFIEDQKNFFNYNKVKSKDIVPNCNVRINLGILDRSKLYESIEIVKNKYKDLLNQLTNNLISNIK